MLQSNSLSETLCIFRSTVKGLFYELLLLICLLCAGKSPKQRQRIDSISNNALQPRCCGKHKDLLQYFCNEPSCSQLLCCQCLATGNHSDHDWKELGQAFVSMATRLEQAGHATKETANTTQRQMRALRTEENRLRSKCETAKASICTNIGDIRSQFDNRKAYFEHNLEHAAQRHSFLKHRKPRETLSMEYEALQELQKHGEDVLVGLATEDAMSLGDVEKATDRLKEIQDTVRKFQTQCSLHTSQFEANPSKVRAKLSNYGEVKVDTFEQESHSSSIEPYESVFKSKQRPRSRSATEVSSLAAAAQQSFSSRQYSRMKHPPVPAKPSRHQSMGGPIGATKNNGVFVRVLPSHPSSPTHFKRSGNMTFSHRPKSAEIACRSVASQHQEDTEDIYDDPYSPPIFFLIPPPPSFAPPPSPPPCQDGTQYLEVINSK